MIVVHTDKLPCICYFSESTEEILLCREIISRIIWDKPTMVTSISIHKYILYSIHTYYLDSCSVLYSLQTYVL